MTENKKKILVIDDEEDLLAIVRYEFETEGFEIVTASNGTEALEILKKIEPQLIILDYVMPEMDGLEFYKSILDEKGKSRYPVLVLTAHIALEAKFKELDVACFMTKPFEGVELVQKAQELIKNAKN